MSFFEPLKFSTLPKRSSCLYNENNDIFNIYRFKGRGSIMKRTSKKNFLWWCTLIIIGIIGGIGGNIDQFEKKKDR